MKRCIGVFASVVGIAILANSPMIGFTCGALLWARWQQHVLAVLLGTPIALALPVFLLAHPFTRLRVFYAASISFLRLRLAQTHLLHRHLS